MKLIQEIAETCWDLLGDEEKKRLREWNLLSKSFRQSSVYQAELDEAAETEAESEILPAVAEEEIGAEREQEDLNLIADEIQEKFDSNDLKSRIQRVKETEHSPGASDISRWILREGIPSLPKAFRVLAKEGGFALGEEVCPDNLEEHVRNCIARNKFRYRDFLELASWRKWKNWPLVGAAPIAYEVVIRSRAGDLCPPENFNWITGFAPVSRMIGIRVLQVSVCRIFLELAFEPEIHRWHKKMSPHFLRTIEKTVEQADTEAPLSSMNHFLQW